MSENVGEVSLQLQRVPTGVQCVTVDINTNGSPGSTKSFAVTANQSPVTLNLAQLPLALVQLSGKAYNVACSAVASNTPTWVADPLFITVAAGQVNPLAMSFREYLPTQAATNFITGFTKVAAGGHSTAVVTSNGDVAVTGELANYGTKRMGLTNVKDVKLGLASACALKTDGTVWCWGANYYGQLGQGNTTPSTVPVKVNLPYPIGQISMGYHHVFASSNGDNGQVRNYCWGYNQNGECGDGTYTEAEWTPVYVGQFSQISAGGSHTCGTDGDYMSCWGYNGFGQRGNGTTVGTPVAGIDNLRFSAPLVQMATGAYHSCALLADGTVWCWGYNGYGQLGIGSTNSATVPTRVLGLYLSGSNIQLSAGEDFTCATDDRGMVCWGNNAAGQLGGWGNANATAPVEITTERSNLLATGSSAQHGCFADVDRASLKCWGSNLYGQIDTSGANRFVPTTVTNF